MQALLFLNSFTLRWDKYMGRTILLYFINFIYMEFIFHLYFWKDVRIFVPTALGLALTVSAFQAFLVSVLKGKAGKVCFGIFLGVDYLFFAVQMVYRAIFKQPLMIKAVFEAGGDALTTFWRETLQGIADTGLGLFALFLGVLWIIIVSQIWQRVSAPWSVKRFGIQVVCLVGSVLLLAGMLFGVYKLAPETYDEYQEFNDPAGTLEGMGVLSFSARDMGLLYLPERELDVILVQGQPTLNGSQTSEGAKDDNEEGTSEDVSGTDGSQGSEMPGNNGDGSYGGIDGSQSAEGTQNGDGTGGHGTDGSSESENGNGDKEPEAAVPMPQILDVDIDYLKEIGSDDVDKITDYVLSLEPTMTNEYTGLFAGKNLIYITAEGFSTAAVDETLTPTLYALTHSGVVVPEYYVPLWQTSTSDGEYVNLTGLIPDQQFSMKRSAVNAQPYSLANYFKAEGAVSLAYHNNTMDYYSRHLSHPNLGYLFKASKLGNLNAEEWGQYQFTMANPKFWPASDLEMMQATLPDYIGEERFHVYYMTVSGHMNYNFLGNKMSWLHREAVADLPYSEEGRAYIACNMELDRALEYLISELEAAGRLADTVICLSTDHYPYGMVQANYDELMGQPLANTLDLYRNSLILWNSEMETVTIEEPCSSLDLVPTLLNLFGFSYDSRLFSGRDIFSDRAPLVVFSNRSFITDAASYNKKTGEVLSRTEVPVSEAYVEQMKNYVKLLYRHSAGIIQHDYYNYFNQAVEHRKAQTVN